MEAAAPRCGKCGTELIDAEDIAATKHSSSKAMCKGCHALTVMIFRNASDFLSSMDTDAQCDFFRQMHAKRLETGGLLRWKLVRPQLIESTSKQAIVQARDGVGGSYQPLAYYRLKGYDVESIEKNCPCETHPVLGKTYLLKTHHVDDSSITKDVEERLLRAEKEVRRRHMPVQQPARKATKTRPAQEAILLTEKQQALCDDLKELVDLLSDEEDAQTSKSVKGGKGGKPSKAAQNEEKKAQKEAQKLGNKLVQLAHKAMVTLKPVHEKMHKMDEQCKKTKLLDEVDYDTKDIWERGLKEADDAMASVVKALEKTKKEMLVQDDLPFTVDKDVTLLVKASRSAMEALNHFKSERAKARKAGKENAKGGA